MSRLFWVVCLAVYAEDIETWNTLDTSLFWRESFDLTLHSQFRTRNGLDDFYQFRLGPQARMQVLPRLNLGGGYWYRDGESALGRWDDQQRLFGGGEFTVWSGEGDLRVRSYIERFFGGSARAFTRYRERARFDILRFRIAPFASVEFFLTRDGWIDTRPGGGFRTRVGPNLRLEIAYYYDRPRITVAPARHIISTGLQLDFGSR